MLVFPEENKTGAARAGAHLQVKTKGRGALNLWKVDGSAPTEGVQRIFLD